MEKENKIWLIRSQSELTEKRISCHFIPCDDLSAVSNEELRAKLKISTVQEARLAVSVAIAEDFARTIRIGDYAIVTNRNQKDYLSIVKITGDYHFDDNEKTHYRDVVPLVQISRNTLSDNFRRVVLRKPRAVCSLALTEEVLEVIRDAEQATVSDSSLTAVFPLRNNFSISINIPDDLSKMEAERLSGFVKSLWQVE